MGGQLGIAIPDKDIVFACTAELWLLNDSPEAVADTIRAYLQQD
jgi:hypothetical protein